MVAPNKKYDSSFTAGGLLFREFNSISSILDSVNFILKIKNEIIKNSLIGISTESARRRIVTELKKRYQVVSSEFWSWYLSLQVNEQKLALFFICLKTYPLIMDLQIEVAIKKYRTGDHLDSFAVKMRLDELSATNEWVGSWSETTLTKVNSQYRGILRDCGLLIGETLQPLTNISNAFWYYFDDIGESWFKEMCFKL